MIIDARQGELGWYVWHAELCQRLNYIVWVNDQTNEYCQLIFPFVMDREKAFGKTVTKKAKKIEIIFERKTIIINPLEWPEQEQNLLEEILEEENPFG